MKDWIPLFQTTLWVGLIVFACVNFKKQVLLLIHTLSRRVESGDSIKVGSFELGQSLKPIAQEEQEVKLEREISEILPNIGSNEKRKSEQIQRFLFVEDAVINSLQSEYGVLINRQVNAGGRADFDGFFVSAGEPYGVEVKYIPGKHLKIEAFLSQVESIHQQIQGIGWKKFTLLFVIVFDEHDRHFRAGLKSLRRSLNNIGGKTILRTYRYGHLESLMQGVEYSANNANAADAKSRAAD